MWDVHKLLSVRSQSLNIIIFLHGLGCLTCSSIDALPSFSGATTVSSSSRFVVEGVFRVSSVVHSLKAVDAVLFVFDSTAFYSRDLQFFSHNFASYIILPCVSRNTSFKAHLCSFWPVMSLFVVTHDSLPYSSDGLATNL